MKQEAQFLTVAVCGFLKISKTGKILWNQKSRQAERQSVLEGTENNGLRKHVFVVSECILRHTHTHICTHILFIHPIMPSSAMKAFITTVASVKVLMCCQKSRHQSPDRVEETILPTTYNERIPDVSRKLIFTDSHVTTQIPAQILAPA